MDQRPTSAATSAVADDWQTVSTPQTGENDWETVPGVHDPALTRTGTNPAGFPTFQGIPTKPPTFGSRLGESLGIPQSWEQVKSMFNPQDLLLGLGGPVARQIVGGVTQPMTPAEKADMEKHPAGQVVNQVVKRTLEGPLAPVGGTAVSNIATDLGSKHVGPALGDLLGTITNLVALGHANPNPEAQLNKLTAAAGAKGAKNIANTIDLLNQTKEAHAMPVESVNDFLKVVKKAKDNINSEYGNALGPYAQMPIAGNPISQRILSLVTPDMQFTKEGRAEIGAIKNAAVEYQKPWTLSALDSKRSRLAADLAAHNAKESVSRYTAERGNVNLAIDNAILDSLRDTVYPQADTLAGKPAGYFENLKGQQSNLINLEKTLNNRIDDLVGKSREKQGQPVLDRLHGHAFVGESGVPHGYISGLMDALRGKDVLKSANQAAKAGFNTSRPVSRAIVLSYPIRALASDQEQPEKWWNPVPMQ